MAPSVAAEPVLVLPPVVAPVREALTVELLHRALTHHGGFTVDHRTGALVRQGLAVCAEPSSSLAFPFGSWCDETVGCWLSSRARRLGRGDVHVGGWHDRRADHVWLDLVHVFEDDERDRALEVGLRHQQRAVFDLGRGCEIWLPTIVGEAWV